MYNIIQQLNENNGSNYKMDVLREHADNTLLQRILKMTYDKVSHTYGISLKNIVDLKRATSMTLTEALDVLDKEFVTRHTTGNHAIEVLSFMLAQLNDNDKHILRGIINRDLRINMGRSNINKVFKGLIVKPVYMRCGLYSDKTKSKINPKGAYVQLKADGTYRDFTVVNGVVSCNSRTGEEYAYPALAAVFSKFRDGHYIGELTVLKNGKVLDRATGNGLINSDEPPHDDIVVDLWDFVTLEEYSGAANKFKGTTPYFSRFERLQEIIEDGPANNKVRIIETHRISTIPEALKFCMDWMNDGFEGAILKDANAIFRDGTSPQQLKLKVEFTLDVRVTGFIEGKQGTKREKTFGSMSYKTDDNMIKGSVSGFTDKQLLEINQNRKEYIGRIIEITGNNLTQGQSNSHFAVSHPRFSCIRDDKNETDDLQRAQESLLMSKSLGE
jgi:DNA ligase-1